MPNVEPDPPKPKPYKGMSAFKDAKFDMISVWVRDMLETDQHKFFIRYLASMIDSVAMAVLDPKAEKSEISPEFHRGQYNAFMRVIRFFDELRTEYDKRLQHREQRPE